MSLSIGIVGLPNVGKSTLFNALTRQSVDAANYPFCTIDPSVGIVPVPDERLGKLSELSKSAETIPAVVEFVDIAGLVAGASKGEGLGNKFLSHIKEVDAIAQVVRVFGGTDITHVSGSIDPIRDIKVINLELVLADLETVTKRLANLEKDVRSGDKKAKTEMDVLVRIQSTLEAENLASETPIADEESGLVRQLNLLTLKPILYVLNIAEGVILPEDVVALVREQGSDYVTVNARVEEDIKDIEVGEKETYRRELGGGGSELDDLIAKGYSILDLITFFTTGEKETRAWTTHRGATAPQAGASIHTDFEQKFIRAEVVFWKDLIKSGSYASARESGLVRTEGKEYVLKDGDVMLFKI